VAYGISTFHPFTDHAFQLTPGHVRAGIRVMHSGFGPSPIKKLIQS
jgi:hypothetical protein